MSYDESMPVIPFRASSDIKKALRFIAEKRDESVQVVVRGIIYEYLEAHGYLETSRKVVLK